MKGMKELNQKFHELHVFHGEFSLFVVPEGHDRY
jgi:hypothetical protein